MSIWGDLVDLWDVVFDDDDDDDDDDGDEAPIPEIPEQPIEMPEELS